MSDSSSSSSDSSDIAESSAGEEGVEEEDDKEQLSCEMSSQPEVKQSYECNSDEEGEITHGMFSIVQFSLLLTFVNV